MIRPCGIDGLSVSSLQNILKRTIDFGSLKANIAKKLRRLEGVMNNASIIEGKVNTRFKLNTDGTDIEVV